MKAIVPGGMVRALIALGLVSYQTTPALAVGKSAAPAVQLQWVTQLIVKEKSSGLKTQSVAAGGVVSRADVATVQRWSAAAQLPMTYKRAMSGGAHVVTLPSAMSFADAQTVAQRMEASGQFEYVSPDRIMRPTAVANDPQFVNQWSLWPSKVVANGPATTAAGGANITTAWDTTKGASSVNVAVIDTDAAIAIELPVECDTQRLQNPRPAGPMERFAVTENSIKVEKNGFEFRHGGRMTSA